MEHLVNISSNTSPCCELGNVSESSARRLQALTTAAARLEARLGSDHHDVDVARRWDTAVGRTGSSDQASEELTKRQQGLELTAGQAIGPLATALTLSVIHDVGTAGSLAVLAAELAECYAEGGEVDVGLETLYGAAVEASKGGEDFEQGLARLEESACRLGVRCADASASSLVERLHERLGQQSDAPTVRAPNNERRARAIDLSSEVDGASEPLDFESTARQIASEVVAKAASAGSVAPRKRGARHAAHASITNGEKPTVKIGVDEIPVQVVTDELGVDLHADFDALEWSRCIDIGKGVGKLVATLLHLQESEVVPLTWMRLPRGRGVALAQVRIDLPTREDLRVALARPELQDAVENFLMVLNGRVPLSHLELPQALLEPPCEGRASDLALTSPPGGVEGDERVGARGSSAQLREAADSESQSQAGPSVVETDASIDSRSLRLQEIAKETLSIVGGASLKVPLSVTSPAWTDRKFEMTGKLAKRPKRVRGAEVTTTVDREFAWGGDDRPKRLVYLDPLGSSGKRVVVSYDVAHLFPSVLRCAGSASPRCRAVFFETAADGEVIKRVLVSVAPVELADACS